jgi:hypothetical protein
VTIINIDSRVIKKLGASLTDDARVIIYDRLMFIVQAMGLMLPPGPNVIKLFTVVIY